ncbi:hypothetical protein AVEN_159072-1 [Araneus ventricosus]|uniref:RRM domain-containing protein n=1 Tax=Araneus ventricosus TaxID=182803 RepID=A0A4Y2B7W1_ARAVE|nr:hypothetical protein AVEN_159072-1 [Araneus ventricosus]
MGALLPAVPDGWPHHPLSYTEVPVSTALHSAAIVHPALHAQLPPPLTVPHPIPHAAMHHPSQMPPPPPHFVANHATTAAPNSTPPPTQPQPPQCSTLFVANLGHFVQEQELKDIYGRTVFDGQISFNDKPDRRICLHNVVKRHFEFACWICLGNEQASNQGCTCQPSGVTERTRISYGQMWSALSYLDCSENIQKVLLIFTKISFIYIDFI